MGFKLISKSNSIFAIVCLLALHFAAPVSVAMQDNNQLISSRRILQQGIETESPVEQNPDVAPTTSPERELITLQLVDEELANVEKAELDDSQKGTIRNHYLAARRFLVQSQSDAGLAAGFREASRTALEQRDQLQKLIDQIDAASATEELPQASLPKLEQWKVELEQEIVRFQAELKLAAEEPQRRQAKRLKLPTLVADAQNRRGEVCEQLSTEAPESENSLLTRSRMIELQAEKQYLEQELDLFQIERDSYESTDGNLSLQESLAEKKLQRSSMKREMVIAAIGRLREEETDRLLRESHDNLESAPEELKEIANRNLVLTQQLVTATEEQQKTKALLIAGQRAVQKVEVELETMQSRVEAVGLSYEVGAMLRRNKSDLMNRKEPFQVEDVADKIQSGQLRKFRWQDERAELAELSSVLDKALPRDALSRERRLDILPAATELLESRKTILEELEDAEVTLLREHGDIKSLQMQYAEKSREYAEFLNERILWVRSEPALGFADEKGVRDIEVAQKGIKWLVAPGNWKSVGASIVHCFRTNLPTVALMVIGLLALVLMQPRARGELRRLGEVAVKRGCREFSPTVSGLMYTAILALFWPAIGLAIGWLITTCHQSTFAWGIGRAFMVTSLVALPLEMLRCICRNEGLSQNHFNWTEGFRKAFKNNATWFMLFGVPLLFLIVAIESSNISNFNRLGRIAMLVLLSVCLLFFFRIFSVFRYGGASFVSEASGFDATVNRLRILLFYVILIGFGFLFLFSVLGYYESVYKIGASLLQTLQLLVWTLIAFGMAMRFFLIRRRKLRFEQLVQQRKAAIAAAEKQAESGMSLASEALDIDLQAESGMDITDVSRQARELTGVIFLIVVVLSLLGIWQYLLPATKILDSWELWRVTIGSAVETVTARDLLLSLIAFALTFFSVRNIPGMLELLLLQRLPLDAGARYAVASILRYILLVVGVIIALGFLKIPWSRYSWLVAAVSVGLGFGLQEIVANFVSGLILLLERPVRVGDVVTIDGVTGVVSRIQMRATTVTNWDNQELVVPNKDLISGKLLNWTLSSVINRIALKIGVAYGTDVGKVRETITKIVNRHPDVLKDPPPIIIFEEFGDNSLNFVVRCCTSSIARRWHLIDEINSAINEAFEREGIEIPFPQRVVHMVEELGGDVDSDALH